MQTNSRWSGPPIREVVWEAVQHFTGGDVDVEFAIKDIEQVALDDREAVRASLELALEGLQEGLRKGFKLGDIQAVIDRILPK